MAIYEILKITHQGKSFIVGGIQDGADRTWKTWNSEEELAQAVATAGPDAEVKLDGYLALSFSSKKLDANTKALGFREIPELKKQALAFLESHLEKEKQDHEAHLGGQDWVFDADAFDLHEMELSELDDDNAPSVPVSSDGKTNAEAKKRHEGLIDLLVAQDEARRKARQQEESLKPASTSQSLTSSLGAVASGQPADPESDAFEDLVGGSGEVDFIENDFFDHPLVDHPSNPAVAASSPTPSKKKDPPPGPEDDQRFTAGGHHLRVSLAWQPAAGSGFFHGRRSEMVWASENIRPADVLSVIPVFYRGSAPSIEIRLLHLKASDDQQSNILKLLAQVLSSHLAERPAIVLKEGNMEFILSVQARPEEFCLISQENAELLLQVARASVRATSLNSKVYCLP